MDFHRRWHWEQKGNAENRQAGSQAPIEAGNLPGAYRVGGRSEDDRWLASSEVFIEEPETITPNPETLVEATLVVECEDAVLVEEFENDAEHEINVMEQIFQQQLEETQKELDEIRRREGIRNRHFYRGAVIAACVIVCAIIIGVVYAIVAKEDQQELGNGSLEGTTIPVSQTDSNYPTPSPISVVMSTDSTLVPSFAPVTSTMAPITPTWFTEHYPAADYYWQNSRQLKASDSTANDWFAWSADMSSDSTVAVIGAYACDVAGTNSGCAYVFTVTDAGEWVQTAQLIASDATGGQQFGFSVAVNDDGSIIVVGAVGPSLVTGGSAYVFHRVGDAWLEQGKLVGFSRQGDWFGASAAISGDGTIIVVGSYMDYYNDTRSGVAYLFMYSGTTWGLVTQLTSDDAGNDNQFGYSVAMSTNATTVVVGAKYVDNQNGALYVFNRDEEKNTWMQQAKLTADPSGLEFGLSVDINGDGTTIVAGFEFHNSVYVFERIGGQWVQHSKFAASTGFSGDDKFGRNVCISKDGDIVMVSAFVPDNVARSAYIFARLGNQWNQLDKIVAPGGARGSASGFSLSTNANGTAFIIGTWSDLGGEVGGSAHIYT